jgi:hypothetical protein
MRALLLLGGSSKTQLAEGNILKDGLELQESSYCKTVTTDELGRFLVEREVLTNQCREKKIKFEMSKNRR